MNLPDEDVDEDAQAQQMGAGHDPVVDFHFALVDVVGQKRTTSRLPDSSRYLNSIRAVLHR